MPIAFVFGGGGARGAFQAGAYAAFAGCGVRPDFVIGSSIGAINALASTRMTGQALVQWWLTRAPERLLPSPLARLRPVVSDLIALPRIAPWPVLAVTTAIGRPKPHVVMLRGQASHQRQWLIASAAMPGVIPAQKIAGGWYMDGGVRNDLAIDIARELGATTVVAFGAGGWGRVPEARADFAVMPQTTLPSVLDFSPPSRVEMLRDGWAAGRALMRQPLFAHWCARVLENQR